ncbi:glycosyltransferase [Salinirubrum litoreum]|uniref:Glycosyltransferase n=1 Tax=Salinirubrum litoreum TaxID=1126234 RepID=A0ABD5RFE1_9EURY|nr:glycosyltransferase [Salinirubrum litoreum]
MNVTLVSTLPDTASGTGQYAERLASHLAEGMRLTRLSLPTDATDPRPFLAGALRAGDGETDVVHVQFDYVVFGPLGLYVLCFFPLLWFQSKRHGFAVVTTIHEVLNADLVGPPLVPLKRLYVRLLNEVVARTTSEVVFLSAEAESRFVASVGDVSRTRLAHGVDLSARRSVQQAEARATFDLSPDADVVVAPGYVSPRKGSDVVRAVADACPEVEFLLAGGPPRERHSDFFDSIVADAPENLTVTGRLSESDFHAAFLAGDLALLPYREIEQTGVVNAVNQSGVFNWCAGYGLPVLAGDCAHFRSISAEWDVVRLVDPSDPDSIAETVRTLLADNSARGILAESASAYAEAHSMDAVADDHRTLYREVRR